MRVLGGVEHQPWLLLGDTGRPLAGSCLKDW